MSAAKCPFGFNFPLPSEREEAGKETTGKAYINLLDPVKYTLEEIRIYQRKMLTKLR